MLMAKTQSERRRRSQIISLSDSNLLRGTSLSVVLDACGSTLRKSSGSNDDFAKSFVKDSVDTFLSHSWHAPWLWKYVSLLLHYNLLPALISAVLSAIAALFVQRQEKRLLQAFMTINCLSYDPQPFGNGVSFYTGIGVFVLVLCTWHHFVHIIYPSSVFLDKVCIDQENDVAKKAGIKALGAILSRSREMLVVLDASYFTRLWCTYELSAFRYCRPDGYIKVVPADLGPFAVAGFGLAVFAALAIRWCVFYLGALKWDYELMAVYMLMGTTSFAVGSVLLRKYIIALNNLSCQLAQFTVRNARCFCCDNAHVHPDSLHCLPCDRDLVYASIATWHGGGDQDRGLDAFDANIRGSFKDDMAAFFGKRSRVPYTYALMLGLPSFFEDLDKMVPCSLSHHSPRAVETSLLWWPLCVFVWLLIVRRITTFFELETRPCNRFFQFIINVCFGLLVFVFSSALTALSYSLSSGLIDRYGVGYFTWLVLEASTVAYMYSLKPWRQDTGDEDFANEMALMTSTSSA